MSVHFQVGPPEHDWPPTPAQERAMAAVSLLTVEPTDRALTGWCPFGTSKHTKWKEYAVMDSRRVMDIVSSYVWG